MTATLTRAPAPAAVRPARDVAALPWEHLDGVRGARVRTLWESPSSRAVLLLLDRDASVPLHVHPDEEHHAFVVEGWCLVGDRLLDKGSYAHVAAGEPHEVKGEFPFGATILYVFERGAS
jgi:quercetin dioxygenase-like cupin family protein